MTSEPLYADPIFARLYDYQCPWSPDAEYCLQLALSAASVLDIGCGTGRFCTTLAAHGHRDICGVDPAPGMLSIARSRNGSQAVEWIAGDARDIRIGRRFDLIVMTGHAFQTLLTDTDRAATFATIAAHLAPNGRFIFDSRNPVAREWVRWTTDLSRTTFTHPDLGPVTS